ncbi:oxidoreductase [Polaribacter pacificus]|uniref:Oxidoreductase n=1 Tax=Polaribacter pacificus TaxID=1775173 RepID=A0A917MGU0_9FLAO|nr:SDR family oxidoreductase [Polaribacter pacificus]GGH01664.1 oxidoreductase [Polaribacter pacificus]
MEKKYLNLKNKKFIITGATSGIGQAVALSLLNQGAEVIGVGRDESKIKDSELIKSNFFIFRSFNLANTVGLEELITQFVSEKGKLDGFVHCAGKEETIPLSVYKADKIRSIFEINVFSGIELLRIFSKKKYSNEDASVILFSSVMGELGQPGKVGYCATKAAVLGVVKAAALELAKRKIRVNAISPGVVKTPMTQQLFDQLSETNIMEIENMHPLGVGSVKDIVPAVLFLLSIDSKWITGQNLKIDGGYSIQ